MARGDDVRRWVGRGFAVFYLLSVTVAVILVALIGETLLAVWLAALEVASVITTSLVTRASARARASRAAGTAPTPRTRLGTPLDPGMPSGR